MSDKISVNFSDNQAPNLRDTMGSGSLKGRVMIHSKDMRNPNEGYKLEQDTSNLIIYAGRSWLLNRAFNRDLGEVVSYTDNSVSTAAVPSYRTGFKNKFISFFSVGTGGSVTGDPLSPAAVTGYDAGLFTPGTVAGIAGKYAVANNNQTFHLFDDGFPKFISDQDINSANFGNSNTFVDPITNSAKNVNSYLVSLIQVTLEANEANGTTPSLESGGPYQDLNEACLWAAPSIVPSYYDSLDSGSRAIAMTPFAHVSFSTIRKHPSRSIVFSWYIYF